MTMFDEYFFLVGAAGEPVRGSRVRAHGREIETPKIHDPRFSIRCF